MGKLVALEKDTGGKVPGLPRCRDLLELTPGGTHTAPGETVGDCCPLCIANETHPGNGFMCGWVTESCGA